VTIEPRPIDVLATPAEVMAFLASLAGPQWILVSSSEELQRVTLRSKPNALSFGVIVQASLLPYGTGTRVILEARPVYRLNLSAGVGRALATVQANLRRRFPVPTGTPV
jgi:hypothetical protein